MRLTIGMASYNNRAEVWFTIQALRLYQDLSDVEILVVDNYGDDQLKAFVEGACRGQARYILYTERRGTAAPRDLVFREARGEWVMCIDPHILLSPGVVARFKDWITSSPDCTDLLQGPLKYDDLVTHGDAWEDKWGSGMWGTWRNAQVDPDGPAYPIPMQGLGLFACRKDAWLGFNPDFAGFGGEEGYIHEKYRQAGRQVLCLPFLVWTHLFKTGAGDIPYPLIQEERIRNYVLGFQELGLDLKPVIDHFGEDQVRPHIQVRQEGDVKMEIQRAEYGGVDVTGFVRKAVKRGGLHLVVTNHICGQDPQPGVKKYLTVAYTLNGIAGETTVEEHGCLVLPRSRNRRLGIFYSNNNQEHVVKAALQQLAVASAGKADILTSTWRPVDGNPFPELTALTQHSHHLNITLQILQLLYRAEESGEYDYVSFCEHDVLYPEGYFDYPDFDSGVIYNTNLIGICEDGFQTYGHTHDSIPLHQMTMRFSDAKAHFESRVKSAIQHGQVMLEPDLPRTPWACAHPAVHVNHGRNFTNHFGLYSKDTYPVDIYWGDHRSIGIFPEGGAQAA